MSSDNDSYHSAFDSVSTSSCDSFRSLNEGLGDLVRQQFETQNHTFNACHINAQSVPSHYTDLIDAFADANVHSVLISESWLKPHLLSTTYPLPGFVLIRNDRIGKRGGGVAIYLRSNFPYKIVASSSSPYSAAAEYLFLEVWVRGVKILLGVIYCPPSIDYFSSLDSILESLGSEYAHHVIMGDLNTDLLAPSSSRSRKLLDLVQSASMHVLPLKATHHNIEGHDTWLDLILTSAPSLVPCHGQLMAPGFSHHDLIFLSYSLKPIKHNPKVLYRRCFGRLNWDTFRQDVGNLRWDNVLATSTVDEKVASFSSTLLQLYNTYAPIKKVKLKHPPAPWMNCEIRMAMRRRDRAFRKFKRERSEVNWSLFKSARNRCNQMIRNAKRRHILDNISASSPANIWKFLGTLGIGKDKNLDCPKVIGLDDINHHFSSVAPIDLQTKHRTLNFLSNLPSPNINPFKFSRVASDEINKIILSIKSNAMGCDNISRRMIIPILDLLLPIITHIINASLESGVFPSLWRKAYVIPLPKIPNPSMANHFRPISILPFLSKVLEACVHKQLSRFVHKNNLLSPLQSGFRPGHSTVSALLKVTGDIRAGMEKSKVTVLALVDFSNAFNTVSHDILLSILSNHMVSAEALEWFSSYLRGRQQSVRLDDSSSNWRNIDSGVPQGGILSPLLFSIFINLITQNLQCAYHLYADDLQIYSQASVDDVSTAIHCVNRDLAQIKSWSDSFGLTVNPSKCQAIVVGSPRMMSRLDIKNIPTLEYNGTSIAWCPVVKDLGLYVDTTLCWRTQLTSVCQKVTNSLRALYRLKNFLPVSTKTMLVQSLIFPIIDYGDVCYFDLNADYLNKLDRLLNNCIRFIFNLRKYDHISSFRSQLNWLPIRQRRSLRALNTLFSILKSPSPPSYLSQHFHYLGSNHAKNLRSLDNLLLECPSHSSDFIHSSFFIQSILLWNALPLEIRTVTTRLTFKSKVRQLWLGRLMESDLH